MIDAMGNRILGAPEPSPEQAGILGRLLERRRVLRAARRAARDAAAVAALHAALREWADGQPDRARFVAALATECRGVWLREAATGRLRRWFLATDHEGMCDLQVHVDLEGLRRAVGRGRVEGAPEDLAGLQRLVDLATPA
ncbi:hypothetical protein BBK14_01725 [Parafrankia soli]|uniref:Uncharacterized protein n=1 Tax=Parafrankia soli TaxID=2599596 RepID=A0A1S1RIN9_9ACTN|nr:hypothetical protein [Parafrankia soli]OHV46593.1 hypothetical protein BBK14_01725 [Parafrankia soli]